MGWHVDLKSQVSGLADLLSDIHDREMRISALLHEFGFPDDAIDTARLSRERVRQLQQQALRRCRARQHQWKNGFHDAVRDFFWANEPPPASTLTGRADGEPTA